MANFGRNDGNFDTSQNHSSTSLTTSELYTETTQTLHTNHTNTNNYPNNQSPTKIASSSKRHLTTQSDNGAAHSPPLILTQQTTPAAGASQKDQVSNGKSGGISGTVQNLRTITSSSGVSPPQATYPSSQQSSSKQQQQKANSNTNDGETSKPQKRMSKMEIRNQMRNAGVVSASNKRS